MRNFSILPLFCFLGICASNAQSIIGLTPTSASQGETMTVAMTGQNTSFGQGTSTTNVWFQQGSTTIILPDAIFINSSTTIDCDFTFCSSDLGLYDLIVDNSIDGYMVLPNSFTLNAEPNPPEIVQVDPDSSYRGDILSVSVTGQSTDFAQGTVTTVWLSQGSSTIVGDSVNVTSATDLVAEFSIPTNAAYGLWDVNVIDGGCNLTVTLTEGFTIYDTIVGVQTPKLEYHVNMFPNPSNGIVTLDYEIPIWQTGEFCIYDIAGKEVGCYPLRGGANQSVISLNLKDGMYLHQTRINGEVVATNKLVICESVE
jgi:hypothetical protein